MTIPTNPKYKAVLGESVFCQFASQILAHSRVLDKNICSDYVSYLPYPKTQHNSFGGDLRNISLPNPRARASGIKAAIDPLCSDPHSCLRRRTSICLSPLENIDICSVVIDSLLKNNEKNGKHMLNQMEGNCIKCLGRHFG